MSAGSRNAERPSSISSTLLKQVRQRRPEAWQRLVELTGPLVYRWCRASGVPREDAADVVQEVFRAIAVHVDDFRRDRPGDSFTAWLAAITRSKIGDHFRRRRGEPRARGGTTAQRQMAAIPEADLPSDEPVGDDADVQTWLSQRALELVRAEFENRTWEAFWRSTVDGRPPADVAEELGMSLHAVYKARSRVLRRLRQELDGLAQ